MNITEQNPAADRLQPIDRPFQPLHDRILVRRLPDLGDKNAIFAPECAWIPSMRGEILSVGLGKRDKDGFRRPLAVKPGDIVYFGRYTDYDDGNLLLIQEGDVVGIVST